MSLSSVYLGSPPCPICGGTRMRCTSRHRKPLHELARYESNYFCERCEVMVPKIATFLPLAEALKQVDPRTKFFQLLKAKASFASAVTAALVEVTQ